ncbi:unnamed protein product, partial [Phaeothamnion confervicola]
RCRRRQPPRPRRCRLGKRPARSDGSRGGVGAAGGLRMEAAPDTSGRRRGRADQPGDHARASGGRREEPKEDRPRSGAVLDGAFVLGGSAGDGSFGAGSDGWGGDGGGDGRRQGCGGLVRSVGGRGRAGGQAAVVRSCVGA